MKFLNGLENWITTHQGIMTSVGILVLVSGLALITTFIANGAARNRLVSEIRTHAELKKSEFRQAWINDQRNDLAALVGASLRLTLDDPIVTETDASTFARILMRMNPKDEDYKELKELLERHTYGLNQGESLVFEHSLIEIGQRILKREWEVLKKELNQTNSRHTE